MKTIQTQGPDPQKTIKNQSKIDTKFRSEFSIVFSSILDEISLHFDSQIRPRASKNRSRDSPRASKTPPRHQKPPKDLPRASPDLPKTLPRTISNHFFIQKWVSEPQFSSQEFPISKIDSPKSTFGGRRHGACPINIYTLPMISVWTIVAEKYDY